MIIFGIDFKAFFLQTDIHLIYQLFIVVFAILIIIQTFELLFLSPYFISSSNEKKSNNQKAISQNNTLLIWDYNFIQNQYSNFNYSIKKLMDFFLIDNNFKKILYINIILSIFLVVNNIILFLPINFLIIILLIIVQLLVSNRFGGSFNGASDSKVLMIMISILIFELDEISDLLDFEFESKINQKLSFIYLTFNVSNSYFSAGLVKLKEKNWIKGLALRIFLEESIIDSNFKNKVLKLLQFNLLSRFLSIFIILWEISIIIIAFMPNYLIIYLIIGLFFHFCNYLLFGLNRFFLLWVITYPILIYTSIHYLSTLGMCIL